MPGQHVLHGFSTSSSPAGEGGAMRVLNPQAAQPSTLYFFAWLVLLGVLVPAGILGGLRVGGFQFVFRSR